MAHRLVPHESQPRPGLDLAGFNRLADELEDEAIMDKAGGVGCDPEGVQGAARVEPVRPRHGGR